MEISCFPSSALRFSDLRCHQIVASPRLPAKLLGRASSKYSQISPSRISISGWKGYSVLLSNSTHVLKPALLQHYSYSAEILIDNKKKVQATFSDVSNEKNDDVKKEKTDPRMQFAIQYTFVQFSFMLARRLVENPHVLQGLNWLIIIKILAAFVSVACANYYMIGINIIYDVEIDKINHPDLHLNSGECNQQTAWVIMLCLVTISLLIAGISKSVPFVIFIFASHFLSSIYSIPPLRTKVTTLGAPATNGLLQGFAIFFATYVGAGAALGLPFQMSLPMKFMSIFNIIYASTMGFLKDIRDMEGDSKNNIPTIALTIGARKTQLIGTCILVINHLFAVMIAATNLKAFKSHIMIPGHILSIFYLLYQTWKMERANYEKAQNIQSYVGFARNYLAHLILLPFI